MPSQRDIRAGRAYVELGVHDKLTRGLKRAQARLRAFGTAVTAVGRRLLTTGLAAAAPLGLATKRFAGFQDAMLAVRAVSGATRREFARLTDQAQALGRATSFTAQQVAEGMGSLGRAGFSAAEIRSAIPAVLDLARATRTELGQAADYAAGAVRAFGLAAGDTTRVADVLTATANHSAQTLDDLAESLKYAAPVAAAAGESIESTAQSLGVLANMGIRGSMAGTTIRQILLRLADPSVRQQLAGLGVAATDAAGNLRPLGDVLAEVGQAIGSMPTANRLGAVTALFDRRAVAGALKLAGSTGQIKALAEAIARSGDAAARTARMMDSGLGGAMRRMWSAAEGAALAVGGALAPNLRAAARHIQRIAGKVAEWVDANRGLVATIGRVVSGTVAAGAAMVAAGLAVKGLGLALSVASVPLSLAVTAVKGLAVALGAVLSPVGLVVTAVAALGAYVLYATGAAGKAIDWLGRRFGGLAGEARDTVAGVRDAMAAGDVASAARVLWAGVQVAWQRGVGALLDVWLTFKHGFLRLVYATWYGVLRVAEHVGHALAVAWVHTTGFLSHAWIDAWATIQTTTLNGASYVATAMHTVATAWSATTAFLREEWARYTGWIGPLWTRTVDIIIREWDRFTSIVGQLWRPVHRFLAWSLQTIRATWEAVWDSVVVRFACDRFVAMWRAAFENIQRAGEAAWSFLVRFAHAAVRAQGQMLGAMLRGFVAAARVLGPLAKPAIDAALAGAKQIAAIVERTNPAKTIANAKASANAAAAEARRGSAAIDTELAKRLDAIETEKAAALKAQAAEQKKRLADEDKRHTQRMAALDAEHTKAQADLDAERKRREGAAAKALADAQADLDAARTEAMYARYWALDAGGADAGGPGKLTDPKAILANLAAAGGPGETMRQQARASTRGTFNAAAGLFGFGGGTAAEKTARNTEAMQRDMARLRKDLGPVLAALSLYK